MLAWSRNGDWAVIHTDTGATPPLALADPKSVAVGDRLIVFNVEAGSRVIGGIDIGGWQTLEGFGERIQLWPALAPETAGGPILTLYGKVAPGPSQEMSEFSRKDAQIWVYSMWAQKGKLSKGVLSAKVYDGRNRLRVAVPARKVTLTPATMRMSFGFSPDSLQPDVYRIDLLWDNHPVWRTFIRITD